jgi:hypothetical protein
MTMLVEFRAADVVRATPRSSIIFVAARQFFGAGDGAEYVIGSRLQPNLPIEGESTSLDD